MKSWFRDFCASPLPYPLLRPVAVPIPNQTMNQLLPPTVLVPDVQAFMSDFGQKTARFLDVEDVQETKYMGNRPVSWQKVRQPSIAHLSPGKYPKPRQKNVHRTSKTHPSLPTWRYKNLKKKSCLGRAGA